MFITVFITLSKNVRNSLPGCTLDILKFLCKLEQLLIFFLCLLCGETHHTIYIEMFVTVHDKVAALQCEVLFFVWLCKCLASLS